jgi:hypothetical protein
MTRGDSIQSCATLCSQGGKTENLEIARGGGISKKNITGGIPKHPYFAGGNSYLTLNFLLQPCYFLTSFWFTY